MDGLSRSVGAGVYVDYERDKTEDGKPVMLDGRPVREKIKLYLPPMELRHFGLVEAEILKNRKNPVDAVLPELDKLRKHPKMQKYLMDKAYGDLRKDKKINKASVQDVQDYIDSIDGIRFTYAVLFAEGNPKIEITPELVDDVVNQMGEDEAKRLRDIASGTGVLGNSTGSPPTGTGEQNSTGQNSSRGGESS